VGNTEGDLHIFKGSNSSPWRKCSDLGMVSSTQLFLLRNGEGY
jgi:hypothetical protein